MGKSTLPRRRRQAAFTLIELLVVITIIAILAGILLSTFNAVGRKSHETVTLSNMRQFGVAAMLYASDNNSRLPNRAIAQPGETAPDKWPTLFYPYIKDLHAYVSPVPDANGKSYRVTDLSKVLSNTANYSSYIINGYNDEGALNNPAYFQQLNNVPLPSQTILFGIPYPQLNQFYMDFSEGGGNNNDVLNRSAFQGGTAAYVFTDGSARLLTYNAKDNMKAAPSSGSVYTDWLWLVDKSRTDVIQ